MLTNNCRIRQEYALSPILYSLQDLCSRVINLTSCYKRFTDDTVLVYKVTFTQKLDNTVDYDL